MEPKKLRRRSAKTTNGSSPFVKDKLLNRSTKNRYPGNLTDRSFPFPTSARNALLFTQKFFIYARLVVGRVSVVSRMGCENT